MLYLIKWLECFSLAVFSGRLEVCDVTGYCPDAVLFLGSDRISLFSSCAHIITFSPAAGAVTPAPMHTSAL